MRILGKVLVGIIVAGAALVAIAYVLPRQVEVTRTATLAAPPEKVYAHVADFSRWQDWSPWAAKDPEMAVEITGDPLAPGHAMSWESGEFGDGSMKITSAAAPRRVDYALDFGGQGSAESWMVLTEAQGGTQVTWGFHTDLGMNPVSRWMGVMFESWIGGDYEAGLAKLADAVTKDGI